jgi:hypothetical protein
VLLASSLSTHAPEASSACPTGQIGTHVRSASLHWRPRAQMRGSSTHEAPLASAIFPTGHATMHEE